MVTAVPGVQGEKWSATKWIHVASLVDGTGADADAADGVCRDSEARCEDWAFNDECTANPKFMLHR